MHQSECVFITVVSFRSRNAVVVTKGNEGASMSAGVDTPPVKSATDTEAALPQQAEVTMDAGEVQEVNTTCISSASVGVQNSTQSNSDGAKTKRKFTVGFDTDEDLFRFIADCEAELDKTVRFERTKSQQQQQQGPTLCEECGKMFAYHSHYVAHRLVHSDERPYDCSSCGRRFKTQHGLRKHAQVHACAPMTIAAGPAGRPIGVT